MPMIKDILTKNDLSLDDINLIVCDIGPGSFTGIRIGIATVKAFHDSLDIPYIGVSSLETLAYNTKNSNLVCSILDANNDNCYFALYERKENYFEELIEPQAESIDSTIAILNSYLEDNFNNSSITFVGDGAESFKNQISNVFKNAIFLDSKQNILNSYNLGLCGFEKYQNGISNEDILPLYLKKPQAQRLLEQKLKDMNNHE